MGPRDTMKSKSFLTILGIAFILAPWVYALIAMRLNPNAGNDGGVLELATYSSLVTVPLGMVLIVIGILQNRKN
jgi:predicted transporter